VKYENLFDGILSALAVALLVFTLCGRAHASEPTPNLEWAFDAVAAADMLTTLDIAKSQPKFQETNALLGAHPSQGVVVGYFAAMGAVHYAITRELVNEGVPAPIVTVWECITIGAEGAYVAHNYSIGLRMKF